MKREIKFRGKTTEKKLWIFGSLLMNIPCNDYSIIDNNDATKFNLVIPDTIGQYTGLRDKNGVEIYEGDIIKTYDDRIQTVIWNNFESGFRLQYKFKRKCYGEEYWETREDIRLKETDSKNFMYEVIGNIYDNKDLLPKEL